MKRLLYLLLLWAGTVGAQTFTYPCQECANTFTGTNVFQGAVTLSGGVSIVGTVTATGFISSTASPALSGVLRGASGDSLVCFRSISGAGDVCIRKTGAAAGNQPADMIDLTAFGAVEANSFDSRNPNPAVGGVLSCTSTDTCVAFRNNANSGDIAGLTKNTSDVVIVGGAAGMSSAGYQVGGVAAANTFLKGNGTQFVSGSPVLASADFANQGTTVTVAHGNAAGNPSWSVVSPADAAGNTSGSGNFALVNAPVFSSISVTNTAAISSVNNTVDAASQAGADWCAKTTTAIAALSTGVGKVTISKSAGTSACAAVLNIPSGVELQWTQTGTWTTSCSGIVFNSATSAEMAAIKGVVLTQPNGCANFSSTVHVNNSTNISIHGFEFNGNGNTQAAGEQNHNIIMSDSNQVRIWDNYFHDAQGDNIISFTDVSMSGGCSDLLIDGNTFFNIGRDQITASSGFGCSDVRVVNNHFTWGTAVTTSTSRGNPIHIELDNVGVANRFTISNNDMSGVQTNCISFTAPDTAQVKQVSVTNNQCSGTNAATNFAGGIILLQAQDVTVSGNHLTFTGATAGSTGILVEESGAISAQDHRNIIADNIVEGMSGTSIYLLGVQASGTPQAFDVHDNIINGGTGTGIWVQNNFNDVDVHDNILTNLQGFGMEFDSTARFHVHHNTIRDFALGGVSIYGIVIGCGGGFTNVGPGEIETNRIGHTTPAGKGGIREDCATATSTVYVYNNDLKDVATPIGYFNGVYVSGPPPTYENTSVPTGVANADLMWADGTAHRWKMNNNGGTADTISGAATTDAFTNKTFNTAATGNVFQINGTGITAVTGSGSVVLATSPTNVTLDAEGTGNTITIPVKVWLPAAGCNNATASTFWDLPTATPAAAACVTGTNTQKGVLDYLDTAGGFSAQTTELLPADFTGTIDARIIWFTTATTGNAKWSLSTICTSVSAAATDDPAFNTASTVTTAAPGVANQIQTSSITGVTITGCSAGQLLHVKLFRDGADAADTITATARFYGLELTIRRAM